jgi:hypothetical protein
LPQLHRLAGNEPLKRSLGSGARRAAGRHFDCGQADLAPVVERKIAAIEDRGDLPCSYQR